MGLHAPTLADMPLLELAIAAALLQGPSSDAACNPALDSPGICLFKDKRYGLAVGQLHVEISGLLAEGSDKLQIASRYLWLGAAYANAGQDEFSRQAFREALRHDPQVRLDVLAPHATDVITKLFDKAAEIGKDDGPPLRRRSPKFWVRLGVMSGFTILDPRHPGNSQQPLSLNVHALVGGKDIPVGLFLATGASPNLRGAPIIGLGYRPARNKPITLFLGGRVETDRSRARWAGGIGVDFRLPR